MTLQRRVLTAIAVTAACLLGLDAALAARMEDLHATRNLDELRKQHGPTRAANALERASRYKEVLSLDADSTLTVIDSSERKTEKHYRLQQKFQGVPVYDATIKISEDSDGNLRSVFGHIAQDLAKDLASTAANLSPQAALTIARRAALVGQNANMPTQNETSEKVIYIGDDSVARVAYKAAFSIAAPSEPSAPTFMIDANTGEILAQWDSMVHANATGPGGNPKTGQYFVPNIIVPPYDYVTSQRTDPRSRSPENPWFQVLTLHSQSST